MLEDVVRADLLTWIEQRSLGGTEPLTSQVLKSEFFSGGRHYALQLQRGIVRPRGFSAPLTITTVFRPPHITPPYQDGTIKLGEYPVYAYQGTDPMAPDNLALRNAFSDQVPLVWLRGVARALYLPYSPTWIVADEPNHLRVRLYVGELAPSLSMFHDGLSQFDRSSTERRYLQRQIMQRVHQPYFRQEVLIAYKDRCAICRLGHRSLLDAAHIIPDSHPDGLPVIQNGLSLCKIHHSAFDNHLIGIAPDLKVHVARKLLQETDGPMLRYGLQEMHMTHLTQPRRKDQQPDLGRIERRWQEFCQHNIEGESG